MQDVKAGGSKSVQSRFHTRQFHILLVPGTVLLWKMQKMMSFKQPLQMFETVNKENTAEFMFRNKKAETSK